MGIKCNKCGELVQSGYAFCPRCGSQILSDDKWICSKCGTDNDKEYAFCMKCGEAKIKSNEHTNNVHIKYLKDNKTKIIAICLVIIALMGVAGYYYSSSDEKTVLTNVASEDTSVKKETDKPTKFEQSFVILSDMKEQIDNIQLGDYQFTGNLNFKFPTIYPPLPSDKDIYIVGNGEKEYILIKRFTPRRKLPADINEFSSDEEELLINEVIQHGYIINRGMTKVNEGVSCLYNGVFRSTSDYDEYYFVHTFITVRNNVGYYIEVAENTTEFSPQPLYFSTYAFLSSLYFD